MTKSPLASTRIVAICATLVAVTGYAQAADLPPIKATESNPVMACATPGRLMAYLKSNNGSMDAKFEGLATEYMRVGKELGLRWDYAFFQMLVETGYLKFTGDVDVAQNNFAGLGATGKGAKGESFPDVATGARAHLQHVAMYAGDTVDSPVAQRTRDVQSWGVLTKWQKSFKRPMTFKDLASKWAPGSRGYPRDIASVAERFENGPCKQADPQPELVAAAEPTSTPAQPETTKDSAQVAVESPTVAGAPAEDAAAVAKAPAVETAKPAAAASTKAAAAPKVATASGAAKAADAAKSVKVLNTTPPADAAAEATPAKEAAPEADKSDAKADATSDKPAKIEDKAFETASVAGGAGKAKIAEPPKGKCKVWQASYGGSKAVIIKATAEKTTNYTVLDVNEGAEKREADAYIAAYAKGGATVAEFATPTQALEKAFELCPEG